MFTTHLENLIITTGSCISYARFVLEKKIAFYYIILNTSVKKKKKKVSICILFLKNKSTFSVTMPADNQN